jgi:ectoine hydroxylase-related dioxygenase (phytanoyl-CoA dioxygenase family)
MTIERLDASAAPEKVAEILARDGACIVVRLVAPELMDRLKAELAPHLEATRPGPDPFSGRNTRRTGGLIARSATARDLVRHPLALATAKRVLHRAKSFQLHLTQVIAIGPGEPAQAIHRDQWAFDFFPFPQGYEVQCNTLWAMTDFTEANGATRVVPGSHLAEDRLQFALEDSEPAEMPKGSVLFYTGAVYHGGGPNRSDATRYGLNLTYVVAWLRQEENQYLSVPREIASTLPEDLLRLMGYAQGAYALGYLDDLRDPIEAVRPELSRTREGFGVLSEAQQRLREKA